MVKLPVVLDLETKYKFSDVNNKRKKLGVSVVGLFDYKSGNGKTFVESEFHALFKLLENCSYIIGFNIKTFDIPVLQAYYPGDLTHFPAFDILDDIRNKLGKRLALNDLLGPTLGKKKTGHGLMAIDYYREGKIDELRQYCLDDVMLTKELFDYGVRERQVFYLRAVTKTPIVVDWSKYLQPPKDQQTHLTLPF